MAERPGRVRLHLLLPWLIGLCGTTAAVVAIWLVVDVPAALNRVQSLDPRWLAIGLLVLAVQFVVRAVRWSCLLGGAARRPVGPGRVVEPLLIGYLGNNVLPARAGEAVRTVALARREAIPAGAVAATVVVERTMDLLMLGVLGAAGVWLVTGAFGASLPLIAGAAAIGVILIALVTRALGQREVMRRPMDRPRLGPVGRLIHGFVDAAARMSPAALGTTAALSLVAWFGDTLLYLAVAEAIGAELALATAIVVAAGGAAGTAAPAAPGYVGTYELAALAGGAAIGLAPETVLPIAIVVHLMAVIPVSIAGAIALGRSGVRLTSRVGQVLPG